MSRQWVQGVMAMMCVVVVVGGVRGAEDTTVSSQQEEVLQKPAVQERQQPEVQNGTEKEFRQSWRRCFQKLTPGCARLLVTKVAEHLPLARLRIAPGITLQANSSQSLELADLVAGLVANPVPDLRLVAKLRSFLEAVTVHVQLEDPALLRQVKTLSEEVVDGLVQTGETVAEGRKKGYGGALLWSAGALAAVGFASLAAVAGKAMMASLMALMLAGMTAMRGGGGGGGGGGSHKYSNVEIIKAPAHFELAPAPHYESGGHYDHDHYYTAPAYEYSRMMTVPRPRGDKTVLVEYKTSTGGQ